MVGKVTDNKKISGSLLAGLMGHSPYTTANEVMANIIKSRAGEELPILKAEHLDWGNIFEPSILDETAKRLNITVKGQINYAVKHKTLPLECSLDTYAVGKGQILENDPSRGIFVLTESGKIKLEGEGAIESKLTSFQKEDILPLYRGPNQLQAQMMCIKAKWGAVAVLYRGICLRIFLFELHDNAVKAITKAVLDLERRIASNPVDWYGITTPEDACLIYPSVNEDESPIDLDDDLNVILKGYLQTKLHIKKLQENIDQTTSIIQSKLGNYSTGKTSKYSVSWPVKNYKEQPEKVVPAKPAKSIRQKTINVKERR